MLGWCLRLCWWRLSLRRRKRWKFQWSHLDFQRLRWWRWSILGLPLFWKAQHLLRLCRRLRIGLLSRECSEWIRSKWSSVCCWRLLLGMAAEFYRRLWILWLRWYWSLERWQLYTLFLLLVLKSQSVGYLKWQLSGLLWCCWLWLLDNPCPAL